MRSLLNDLSRDLPKYLSRNLSKDLKINALDRPDGLHTTPYGRTIPNTKFVP